MIPDRLENLLLYGALFVAICMVAYALYHYFHLPEVHVDPRGQCVKVIEEGRTRTCARIPEKHIRVVVAGRVS